MNRHSPIILLILAILSCSASPLKSQFNLKTGYNISFLSNPGFDEMLADFNATQAYSPSFPNLRWMHGLEAGIRFKSHSHALELGYQGSIQKLRASGELNGGSQSFTDKINFGIHSLTLGYQVAGAVAGLGADFQYQWHNSRAEINHIGSTFRNQQVLPAMKLYLMFIINESYGIDMAIQPFWVMPFEKYDLSSLEQYLQIEQSLTQDTWSRFGLTLVFYNGEK